MFWHGTCGFKDSTVTEMAYRCKILHVHVVLRRTKCEAAEAILASTLLEADRRLQQYFTRIPTCLICVLLII